MRVLVTCGSRLGGTAGLAEEIGGTLRRIGFEADVVPAAEVRSLDGYDAVVVGGALYAGRWHRDARRFVRSFGRELRALPVWLFSSGPLDDSAHERAIPPVPRVARLAARIGARGHTTFGGRLEPGARGVVAGAMAKKLSGDWRRWDEVRTWAIVVGESLRPTVPVP